MSVVPPMNLDPVMLAAYVARAMSKTHRLAFAQIAPDLTVVMHSPNFTAVLEKKHKNIIGMPLKALFGEFIGATPYLIDVLEGRQPNYHLEHVNRQAPDGSMTYLDFKVMPLDDALLKQGLLLLIEDVTHTGLLQQSLTQDRNELRLLQDELTRTNEKLQRISKLKSLILSMAAHDLRAPLSVISGYTGLIQYLKENNDPQKTEAYLEVIQSQTRRINRLITDMVDLDAIDQGKLELKREMCDVTLLVEEAIETLPVVYRNQNITLVQHLPQQPLVASLDKDKISRVVYNLVGNAFKYTPAGGQVTIQLEQVEDNIVLSVSDDGYGMSEEQVNKLFQPYYRTKEARESAVSGSGLGLYIVKMLVSAHKGRVEAASALQKGTTFTIYLPILSE